MRVLVWTLRLEKWDNLVALLQKDNANSAILAHTVSLFWSVYEL